MLPWSHVVQLRNIGADKTLRIWRCGFNVVSTFPLHHLWGELTIQCRDIVHNVINLKLLWRRFKDATFWFQRCNKVDNTTSIVYCKLNLLSIVEATLEQHCNFDVVTSALLQRCVLVVRCRHFTGKLSQRCVFPCLFMCVNITTNTNSKSAVTLFIVKTAGMLQFMLKRFKAR